MSVPSLRVRRIAPLNRSVTTSFFVDPSGVAHGDLAVFIRDSEAEREGSYRKSVISEKKAGKGKEGREGEETKSTHALLSR